MMKKAKFLFVLTAITLTIFMGCTNSVSGKDNINSKLHVQKSDYTKENLIQILLSETPEEMSKLGFYTNEPVQAEITDNGKLKITSYAPVTLKNVKIQVKEKNTDKSFINLALYDEIYGFSQNIQDIPSDIKLTKENAEFKVTAEGEFWQKIKTITHPLKITFAQGNEGPWQQMTPEAGRKAVVVGTTMSYMFNHKDYKEHLKKWNEGGYKGQGVTYEPFPGFVMSLLPSAPFKNDDGSPLSYEKVYNQAINRGQINFSLIKENQPAGGIGGGNTLGLRSYLFDNFLKYKTLQVTGQKNTRDLKCTTVDVIFHELAHCMGYYHPDNIKNNPYPGTMTYGGGWTTANYVFLNKLIEKNDLPIPLDGKALENTGFPKN